MNDIDLPLRDIHLPDPISILPWVLLLSLLVILSVGLLFILYRVIKRRLHLKLKRKALKALKEIEEAFIKTDDAIICISEISAFLRRVSLYKKKEFAGVTGTAWLKLLDVPLKEPEFSQGIGRILLTAPYSKEVAKEDLIKLLTLCSKWVKTL